MSGGHAGAPFLDGLPAHVMLPACPDLKSGLIRAGLFALALIGALSGVPQAWAQTAQPGDDAALRTTRSLAGRGDPDAQFDLGRRYADGLGVESDDIEAARWFRAAADRGLADTRTNLGIMYATGRGVPRDLGAALAHFRTAAAEGDGRAETYLRRNLDGALRTVGRSGNIRSAPSTDAPVVGKAAAGDRLHVVDERGEWRQIFVAETGLVGWMHADLF